MTRAVVHGAAGRMGRAIVRAIHDTSGIALVGAIDRAGASSVGLDAGELAGVGPLRVSTEASLREELEAHVIIDFSSSEATEAIAAVAAARGLALVVGTTGLEAGARAALERAAAQVPVVVAPNTSVGVTVLAHLAEVATRLLGDGFDAEIVEMHHNKKADAPSGTALRIADVVLAAKGLDRSALRTGREGKPGPRTRSEVGVLAMRGGDVIGDHTLVLAGEGERVELTHKATDRSLFARGAVRAAQWVIRRPAGLYDMRDVLGLR
ncbi:MAG: 4-hydroxy-tetrahydrodipicolinate reductase [Sandaracinaceae bacterium]|nr:4-hydroxy-tetrahydrodipicolinate reductase [Sandaracinaceae bacterium]